MQAVEAALLALPVRLAQAVPAAVERLLQAAEARVLERLIPEAVVAVFHGIPAVLVQAAPASSFSNTPSQSNLS